MTEEDRRSIGCCACLLGVGRRAAHDNDDEKAMFEMKVQEKRKKDKMDWRCYWDRFGVMRREKAPLKLDKSDFKHKPFAELMEMNDRDQEYFDPEEEIFLINLDWLNQWLRFAVHGASTPGPISNGVLVTAKTKKFKKKAKYNLHWRPVGKDVWDFLFIGNRSGGGYGGGPTIKFKYEGDAPLVGKNDIAEYMTKTKIFKLASVIFEMPDPPEDEEGISRYSSPFVRESGVFPVTYRGPPPYDNPLANMEQERRSNENNRVADKEKGLINPLHSDLDNAREGNGNDDAQDETGSISPLHRLRASRSDQEGVLMSLDGRSEAAPPPSDDEGTLSDDDDDLAFIEVAGAEVGNAQGYPSSAESPIAIDSDEEDEGFVQAGLVVTGSPDSSRAHTETSRGSDLDLLEATQDDLDIIHDSGDDLLDLGSGTASQAPVSDLETTNSLTNNLSIPRGFDNLDADDIDLLGLEHDLELDDDEKGTSDPSQVIFDHELEDI